MTKNATKHDKTLALVSATAIFLIVLAFGLIGHTATKRFNFGLCRGHRQNDDLIDHARLHKITPKMKIQIEKKYQQNFWGLVSFNPVPPFQINTHDPITQDIFISGSVHGKRQWDPYIWDLFVRVLQKDNTNKLVVDVGANLGYFSLLAASMGYHVVAFEPMNRNVVKFLSSIVANGFQDRISVYQNAVAAKSGGMVHLVETHSSNQGNGQISGVGTKGVYGQDYVDTIRLDDAIHTDVLLMKIDVEGSETAVLDGAKRLVCWNVVRFIVIELSQETKKSKQCSALRMLKLFDKLGYVISDVVDDAPRLVPANLEEFPPNILFRLLDTSIPPGHRLKAVCDS